MQTYFHLIDLCRMIRLTDFHLITRMGVLGRIIFSNKELALQVIPMLYENEHNPASKSVANKGF
jgi:hypothetical protein